MTHRRDHGHYKVREHGQQALEPSARLSERFPDSAHVAGLHAHNRVSVTRAPPAGNSGVELAVVSERKSSSSDSKAAMVSWSRVAATGPLDRSAKLFGRHAQPLRQDDQLVLLGESNRPPATSAHVRAHGLPHETAIEFAATAAGLPDRPRLSPGPLSVFRQRLV